MPNREYFRWGDRRLSDCWWNVERRCKDPTAKGYEYYGKKGIENRLTKEDLKTLWLRDNAAVMKKPSIDRIDSSGHYMKDNCRFIEHRDNVKRNQFHGFARKCTCCGVYWRRAISLTLVCSFLLVSGCGVNRFSASTKAYYKTPDGMVVEYESNKENEGVVVEIRTVEDKTKSITIKVEKSGTSEQAISAALASTLELTRMLKDALASALKAGAMAGS